MTTTRYALTCVFEIDDLSGSHDEGVREFFEGAAQAAFDSYATRSVGGKKLLFLALSRESPKGDE